MLQIGHKLKKWHWRHKLPKWRHRQIFLRCSVSLVNFIYWSKSHVNVINGSRVMIIFFYKGLTINPEIGSNPVWVLPNIWRLRQVRHTEFGTDVSNKMLLNAAKCQGYSFYRFWIIKWRPTGGGGELPPPSHQPHTQIRVKAVAARVKLWTNKISNKTLKIRRRARFTERFLAITMTMAIRFSLIFLFCRIEFKYWYPDFALNGNEIHKPWFTKIITSSSTSKWFNCLQLVRRNVW